MAPDESFVGITPMYSMAVWTGYKSRLTPVYGTGLDVAAEVYQAMSSYLFQTNGSGSSDWTMPDGVYRSGGYVAKSGYSNNYSYSSSSSSYNSYSSSSDSQPQSSSSSDSNSSSSNQANQNNDDDNDNDDDE